LSAPTGSQVHGGVSGGSSPPGQTEGEEP
jgi:hypothetical protein